MLFSINWTSHANVTGQFCATNICESAFCYVTAICGTIESGISKVCFRTTVIYTTIILIDLSMNVNIIIISVELQ